MGRGGGGEKEKGFASSLVEFTGDERGARSPSSSFVVAVVVCFVLSLIRSPRSS